MQGELASVTKWGWNLVVYKRLKGRLKFLSSSNGAKSIDWPLSLTGTDGSPCDSLSLLWLNLIDSQLSPQRAVKNHSANKLLALQSLLEC